MRILFLLHSHPELQAGGTEIFARDLFRTLRRGGMEGLFVAGTAAHQRPRSPGTPFQAVGEQADEILLWTDGFDSFFLSQIDLHGTARALATLLAEQQPDIVHIHHILTLGVEIVGLVRRVLPRAKIVMTLHDFYAICANDGQMVTTSGALCHVASGDACHSCFSDRTMTDFRLRDLHIRTALAQIDHFVSPSRFLAERFVAWGLAASRITLIPNGLPDVPQAPLRPAQRRDRFLFLGHINRFKGATVAIGASFRLSSEGVVHGLLLRGGKDHQPEGVVSRFDHMLTSAPDARYEGRYRREEIPKLMAGADWLIFPSEWWENAPLVINEAFQHGRPVLCSGIGGAAELVADGQNGLHFPVGDPAGLAAVMRRAVEEPGLWERLREGVYRPVSIEQSAEHHTELYRSLLGEATISPRRAA